jgi:hypothetical protein
MNMLFGVHCAEGVVHENFFEWINGSRGLGERERERG